MKSIVILVAAGVVFALFMVKTFTKADVLVVREEHALAFLKTRPDLSAGPVEEAGYRFETEGGGDLPTVVVARPLRHAEDGIRHFAMLPDGTIFEFDTVLNRAPHNHPDVAPLLIWLTFPDKERPETMRLFGWTRQQ